MEFWSFLEFLLKKWKIRQPRYEVVKFWIFLNLYWKSEFFSTRVRGSGILEFSGIFTEKVNFFQPGYDVVKFWIFGICNEKVKIFSTRVRCSEILDVLEFVMKKWNFFHPGSDRSEVVRLCVCVCVFLCGCVCVIKIFLRWEENIK